MSRSKDSKNLFNFLQLRQNSLTNLLKKKKKIYNKDNIGPTIKVSRSSVLKYNNLF